MVQDIRCVNPQLNTLRLAYLKRLADVAVKGPYATGLERVGSECAALSGFRVLQENLSGLGIRQCLQSAVTGGIGREISPHCVSVVERSAGSTLGIGNRDEGAWAVWITEEKSADFRRRNSTSPTRFSTSQIPWAHDIGIASAPECLLSGNANGPS